MSEEITLQENETVERTIEVSIDKNGLGIESGQVFPSVTVDFAPILCVTRVPWENIIGRPPIESGEGQDSIVLGTSGAYASGQNSIAQGTSIASGRNSHAEGHETNASGTSSHSEGISTSATGNYSHSEGASTSAGGYSSHAEGYGTMTLNNAEHAQGIFNVSHAKPLGDYEDTLFSIGIGNGSNERANAVEVMRGGDMFVFGIGDYDGTTTDAATLQEVILSANKEISDKANKVSNATSGNFAGLDANGNLTDSGHNHSDYMSANEFVVKYVSQNLKPSHQAQARTNIGAGTSNFNGYYNGLNGRPSINGSQIVATGDYDDSALYELPIVTYREEVDFSDYIEQTGYLSKGGWNSNVGNYYLIPISEDICGLYFKGADKEGQYAIITENQLPNGSDTPPTPIDASTYYAVSVPHMPEAYIYIRSKDSKGIDVLPKHLYFLRLRDRDKTDKVVNATQGNFAALDSSGNLVDSGHTHSDYITSHQDISGKQDKPTITTVSDSTLTQEIADNAIYNAGELSALTITFPNTIAADFISEVNFTSGTTATTVTIPNTILLSGDNLINNVFTPTTNQRYIIMFYSDGVNTRGVIQGFNTI